MRCGSRRHPIKLCAALLGFRLHDHTDGKRYGLACDVNARGDVVQTQRNERVVRILKSARGLREEE